MRADQAGDWGSKSRAKQPSRPGIGSTNGGNLGLGFGVREAESEIRGVGPHSEVGWEALGPLGMVPRDWDLGLGKRVLRSAGAHRRRSAECGLVPLEWAGEVGICGQGGGIRGLGAHTRGLQGTGPTRVGLRGWNLGSDR